MRDVKRPPRRVLPDSAAAAEPTAESSRSGQEVYRSELGAEARPRSDSIDFRSFPPGHTFGREARIHGTIIHALAPSEELTVVGTAYGSTALRIPRSGMRVRLPAATSDLALTGWFEGQSTGETRDRGEEQPSRVRHDRPPPGRWEIRGQEIAEVTVRAGGGLLSAVVWCSDAAAD